MSARRLGKTDVRGAIGGVAVLMSCLALTAAANASPQPVPVKASPTVDERQPAAQGPWLGWGQDDSYFVERGSGRRARVNAPNTVTNGLVYGLCFGAGFSGRTVVYAQAPAGGYTPQYDIWRFDLRTHRRTRLPSTVNTAANETRPSQSKGYLLFERVKKTGQDGHDLAYSVMLYRPRTGSVRRLDRSLLPYGALFYPRLVVGQVNGRYAVWDRRRMVERLSGVDLTHSVVVRYDVRTGSRSRIEGPSGIRLSDPAVSADGTVYYVRTTVKPHGTVDIVRRPLQGPPAVLASLPRGQSASELYVDDLTSGAHAVYYTRHTVGGTDVYKLLDPAAQQSGALPATGR